MRITDRSAKLDKAIIAAADVNNQVDTPQYLYVIEEMSELTKELIKIQRGKGDTSKVIDEACDVLLTVMTMLFQYGAHTSDIIDAIVFKSNRAVERLAELTEA